MASKSIEERIDWVRLLDEFESYEPDEEMCRIDPELFERALLDPPRRFVQAFIGRKRENRSQADIVRALYAFLLNKRYDEQLNLLHFAFRIFDDVSPLPAEVIDRTPFPHEDGVPKFKHFDDPEFRLYPAPKACKT